MSCDTVHVDSYLFYVQIDLCLSLILIYYITRMKFLTENRSRNIRIYTSRQQWSKPFLVTLMSRKRGLQKMVVFMTCMIFFLLFKIEFESTKMNQLLNMQFYNTKPTNLRLRGPHVQPKTNNVIIIS